MKTILSFFAILFAVCAIQAQTTISDDFESYTNFAINPTSQWTFVDEDADSTYGFLSISFPGMFSRMAFMVFNPSQASTDLSSTMPPHSGSKFLACFASATTANNDWVISPDLGTHEGAILTFWARSYTSEYGLEKFKVGYSTTTNSTSSFTFIQGGSYVEAPTTWTQYSYTIPADAKYVAINCVSDNVHLFMLDDIDILIALGPTLIVSTTNVDFGSLILGDSATTAIHITAFDLSDDITATTTAPFEVSADGITFGSTAMVDTAGGTLYIKYVPTVAGASTEDLTLSATGLTDVIVPLTGNAVECNTVTAFPYSCGFEPTEGPTLCWRYIDVNNDGDGENDEFIFTQTTDNNTMVAYIHSDDSTIVSANDWIISPEFEISNGMYASFDYEVGSYLIWTFPETFSVWAIPQGNSIDNAINLVPAQPRGDGSLQNMIVDLSAFAGQTIRIGIKLETPTDEGYYFAVDNFVVDFIASSLNLVSADTIDFGDVGIGGLRIAQATFSAMRITNDINVETAGDYLVSADGTTYSASITLPGDTTQLNFTRNFYIQFSPSAAGTITENVIVSSIDTEDTLTITATGVGIECNAITDFPYQVDFTQEAPCWTIFNDNNDDGKFYINEEDGYAYYRFSSSNAANDWLISPAMAINDENLALTIGYSCEGADYPETFSVWAITDLNNHTGGTQILAPVSANSTSILYTPYVDLTPYSGQTIYIGIKAESAADMYMLYIDDIKVQAGNSINETSVDNTVNVYPNPATSVLNITSTSIINQVEIFNMTGQLIHKTQSTDNNLKINTNDFAQGFYFVKIHNENGMTTKKVSIIK
ncbi:MAG: T9SS type A sorting domain-containing protein [Bacteroidales bacterium]|jgi:hypothetical protein|nr:T9SS type A sorting domain-containing protein [Bacteroidales bacterium]